MLARKGEQLLVHDWQGFTFPGIVISVREVGWVISKLQGLSKLLHQTMPNLLRSHQFAIEDPCLFRQCACGNGGSSLGTQAIRTSKALLIQASEIFVLAFVLA